MIKHIYIRNGVEIKTRYDRKIFDIKLNFNLNVIHSKI